MVGKVSQRVSGSMGQTSNRPIGNRFRHFGRERHAQKLRNEPMRALGAPFKVPGSRLSENAKRTHSEKADRTDRMSGPFFTERTHLPCSAASQPGGLKSAFQ